VQKVLIDGRQLGLEGFPQIFQNLFVAMHSISLSANRANANAAPEHAAAPRARRLLEYYDRCAESVAKTVQTLLARALRMKPRNGSP
jgi:hypothetical protein